MTTKTTTRLVCCIDASDLQRTLDDELLDRDARWLAHARARPARPTQGGLGRPDPAATRTLGRGRGRKGAGA